MPTLIVDQPTRRFGGRITGRVLIGRLPTNGIPLTDSSVSRLHAWVAVNGNGHHFVADTGSLTGTWVNGAAIVRRRDLVDGDVIKVGKTQIIYSAADELPAGVEATDLAGLPPVENVQDAGVLFDCPCGAPAWFKATAIGHTHQCRQCGRTVRIPGAPNEIAEEVSPPSIGEPGVPPALPAPVPAADLQNAMLLHEPTAPAGLPHSEEHGLADSGIHAALAGEAMVEKPHDEAMIDDAYGLGSGLDLSEHSQVEAMLDDATIPEAEAPAIKPPLFERRGEIIEPSPVAETIEPQEEELLDLSTVQAAPEAAAEVEPATCSVCRSAIVTGEEQTVCPSCGLTFHSDCWKDNLGCSAYGCAQVNALQPPEPIEQVTAPDLDAVIAPVVPEEPTGFPWEFMFLFVSVIGSLLGVLCYGVPAMIGLLGTLVYVLFMQESRRRRPVAWIAVLLCIAGITAGVYLSHLYWKGWPPIGPWARTNTTLHPAAGGKR